MIEIGSWAGESAEWWADSIRERLRELDLPQDRMTIYCVDPWKEYPGMPGDMQPHVEWAYGSFQRRAKAYGGSVVPIEGYAHEAVGIFRGQFDLIYLDGDHRYEVVRQDLEDYAPLVKEGGYLCGDDLELQMADLNLDRVTLDLERDTSFYPDRNRDFHAGVTKAVWEILGTVSCYEGFWVTRKGERSWQTVEL